MAQGVREIRRRIKSVQNTQQITRAMKMVAAAKLRRSQDRVIAARPYANKMKDVLSDITVKLGDVRHLLLEKREVKNIGVIVVSADRGLAGGYNANVIRATTDFIKKSSKPVSLITIGRKARDFYKRRDYDIKGEFVALDDSPTIGQATQIIKMVEELYTAGVFDEVYLIYNMFLSAMNQKPVVKKLLPIEKFSQEDDTSKAAAGNTEYIYEPSEQTLFDQILPVYLETLMYQALLEAKASEFGARMTAMDAATNNAAEIISKLTLSLNRARQAGITQEISEIVGGAAALE